MTSPTNIVLDRPSVTSDHACKIVEQAVVGVLHTIAAAEFEPPTHSTHRCEARFNIMVPLTGISYTFGDRCWNREPLKLASDNSHSYRSR